MNYNYTEEHYAEMYNNLPEGLKDLVLSGRLALQVSAIGTRHGLNADQVADLEPAVEDVCLGLILKTQLADNIKTQVGTDDRVANRIAAEVEIEILRPFEPELIIARQQKEDLDKKIASPKQVTPVAQTQNAAPAKAVKEEFEPKDVSEKSNVTAIKNFYNSSSNSGDSKIGNDATQVQDTNKSQGQVNFDWDNFGKKPAPVSEPESPKPITNNQTSTSMSVDEKIDKLTDTINKLVMDRFGGEKKEEGVSEEMKKIMERLEMAEKENQEHKKLIQKLQDNNQLNSLQNNIFDLPKDANKISVDKPRSVEIDKTKTPTTTAPDVSGNVKVQATTQNPIPINNDLGLSSKKSLDLLGDSGKNLASTPKQEESKKEVNMFSSAVSQSTADTIVETRNKENQATPITSSAKKVLSLDELLQKNDSKVNAAKPTTAQIVFPTIGTEKKIDIKNVAQTDGLRQTLLEDIEFLKKKFTSQYVITNSQQNMANQQVNAVVSSNTTQTDTQANQTSKADDDQTQNDLANLTSSQSSVTLSQFKDELVPKTKEDRMRALQDKIKAMNKGVSSGGTNSIAASALDPYKL